MLPTTPASRYVVACGASVATTLHGPLLPVCRSTLTAVSVPAPSNQFKVTCPEALDDAPRKNGAAGGWLVTTADWVVAVLMLL